MLSTVVILFAIFGALLAACGVGLGARGVSMPNTLGWASVPK